MSKSRGVPLFVCALLLCGRALSAAEETPLLVRVTSTDAMAGPIVGIPSPHLSVILRNNTGDKASGIIPPRALVLRSVAWVGGPADPRCWHGPLVGAVNENSDRTFTLNTNAARLTAESFERGLLFPGDEITVKVPFTAQGEESPMLTITYAWAGDSSQWNEGVLLPIDGEGTTRFVPATSDRVVARRHRGGLAALRSTLSHAAAALAEQTISVPVPVVLGSNPNYQLTGGISIIEATWKSGADKLPGSRHGVYCATLQTWFFTTASGRAVAYERVPVKDPPFPPTAPPGFVPKPWKWTPRALPAMDLAAPAAFCRGKDGNTAMKLDTATFGGLLAMTEAGQGHAATAVECQVPADKLWAVLNLAREKGLRLQLAAVNPATDEPLTALEFSSPAK